MRSGDRLRLGATVAFDLREGDKVTYDVVPKKGKESAENLKVK
jgi:cold shock CspA family protein